MLVPIMCSKIKRENLKTKSLCYKIARTQSKEVNEKIKFLTNQVCSREPKFSAAGFFDVDLSMVFMFINLVATYIVVLIQFIRK